MGRDNEVGELFGYTHAKSGAPTKGIWVLSFLSIILGIVTVAMYLGGTTQSALDPKYHNFWYSFGLFDPSVYATAPNTLLIITLISNFGTFLLYMMSCIVAIIAFKEHHTFNGFKHFVVPLFGLLANLGCMLFYIIGPFSVAGMSWKEPFIALGVAAVWGICRRHPLRLAQQEEGEADLPGNTCYRINKRSSLCMGVHAKRSHPEWDVAVCFFRHGSKTQHPRHTPRLLCNCHGTHGKLRPPISYPARAAR
jgi:amino acid transporter